MALEIIELARQFAIQPLAAIIYTDIATDGMLAGPNIAAMAEMQTAVDVPVVASGGGRHPAYTDEQGVAIESGYAVEEVFGPGNWYYAAKTAVPAGKKVIVNVVATDRPGNTAVYQHIINL